MKQHDKKRLYCYLFKLQQAWEDNPAMSQSIANGSEVAVEVQKDFREGKRIVLAPNGNLIFPK